MREEKRLSERCAGFEQWFVALTQEQRQALAHSSPSRDLEGPGFKIPALSHFETLRGGRGETSAGATWMATEVQAVLERDLGL